METQGNGSLGPTSVLKVNLQCCNACPRAVKKQLMQIKGVTGFNMDTEEGLVTVSGIADASILIKAIKKTGRKAELIKFEMQPEKQNDTNCTCEEIPHDTTTDVHDTDVHASQYFSHGSLGYTVPIPGYDQITMQGGPSGYLPGPLPPYPHARSIEGPPSMAYGGPPSQIALRGDHSGYLPGPLPPYPHTRLEGPPPMAYGGPPSPHPYSYYNYQPSLAPEPGPVTYHGEPRLGGDHGSVLGNYPDHTFNRPVGNYPDHTFNDENVNSCTIT